MLKLTMRKNEWTGTMVYAVKDPQGRLSYGEMIALELRSGGATLINRSLVRRLVRNATKCHVIILV